MKQISIPSDIIPTISAFGHASILAHSERYTEETVAAVQVLVSPAPKQSASRETKEVTLFARLADGTKANSNNWAQRVNLVSDCEYWELKEGDADHILLVTPKATYPLQKHPTQNYWHATCNGRKVQVTVKKMLANLRWW